MEFNNRSVILIISIILLTGLIFSFFVPLNYSQESQFQNLSDFLYNSPILKSYRPLFSLEGKKIIDMSHKKDVLIAKNVGPNLTKPIPSAVPTLSPIASPTATPKPKTVSKTDSNIAQTGMTVKNPPNSKNNKESNFSTDNEMGGGYVVPPQFPPSVDREIADWKFKLSQSPTKENMNIFVKAYFQGKVTKTIFYEVITALLDQNDEKVQRIALYGLAATPSYDSYNLLAIRSNDHLLRGSNLEYNHKILDYYSQPSNLAILITALKSPTETVVIEALNNISEISNKTKSNPPELNTNNSPQFNADNRLRRGSISTQSIKTDVLKKLIEALLNLTQSHNQQIAYNSELLIQRLQSNTLQQSSISPPIVNSTDASQNQLSQ